MRNSAASGLNFGAYHLKQIRFAKLMKKDGILRVHDAPSPASLIPENVARKVRVPKNALVDERRRVVLADEELEALMSSPHLGAELATMAFASRTADCA
jgi:hypothetical protein